ncbi:MAG: PPC domain-containing protein [Phycisphaerae bacterium]|nr:PPC domain-containing protein [Phycisphaerae bacterium]
MKKLIFLLMALSLVAGTALAKDALEKPLVPYQGAIRATEVEPNDDCTMANPLAIDDPMSAAISPEADVDWFEFVAEEGECVIFETHPGDIGDTKLFLYDGDCITELAYDDDGGEGYYSLIQYTFDVAGTYYVVVTGYNTSYVGDYILTATACPEPEENDTCEGAIELPTGPIDFQVDLCLYVHDYSPGEYGASCTGYSADGPDAVYMVNLAPGGSIDVCENPADGGYTDGSIYLITDCADPQGSCVVGDDSGNPECISYVSVDGGLYYLIIDTYSGCSLMDITGIVSNPTAAVSSDWGTVKAQY